MTTLLTRKDIARLTGFSVRTVTDRARVWGIEPFRAKTGTRCVRYVASKTIVALKERGLTE